MIVLVPAYEPDRRLVDLVGMLRSSPEIDAVVVVDDGSGAGYAEMFVATAAAGAEVLHLPENRGKGFALKHGYAHIAASHPGQVVVCADCDGQHTPADIVKVGRETARSTGDIVLGVRKFTGKVPLKSRLGNGLTRVLFSMSTGRGVTDTQTGLRAYHPAMLDWLSHVEGDRFEYELEVLLRAKQAGFGIREVPIETIYLEGNKSTHFRPVVDSLRVYGPLVRFCMSSISAFVVDVVALQLVFWATDNLAAAVVSARVVSSSFNFAANRRYVFGDANSSKGMSAAQYFSLAVAILIANYWSMHLFYLVLGLPLLAAKLVTELGLFAVSYQVQKRFIFRFTASARARSAPAQGRTLAAASSVVFGLALVVAPATVPAVGSGEASARTVAPASSAATGVVESARSLGSGLAAARIRLGVPTGWNYSDARVSISIEKFVVGTGNATITYFVATLVFADITTLQSGSVRAAPCTRAAKPMTLAKSANALFAISGDYYGIRCNGLVVRNGRKVIAKGARNGLALYRDGTARVYNERTTTINALLGSGAWQTMSFGPVLLRDGRVSMADIDAAQSYVKRRHPRAGVCVPTPNTVMFILVDGRHPGWSQGMTLPEFAKLFKDRGCSEAYNMDGGQSAALIFDGQIVNKIPGGQRAISDIFYVARP